MASNDFIIEPRKISRRKFLGSAAATAGAVGVSGQFSALQAFAKANGDEAKTVVRDGDIYTICEMCVWRCGVKGRVRNGVIEKLEGNPYHPHSLGKLCPRGQAGLMETYAEDRLKFPLVRVGPRGSGKWRRATWDEALDIIAKNMLNIKEKYGAEAMVFSTTHNLIQKQFENLMRAYGSPNYGTQRSLCFNSMITANLLTYGFEEPGRDYPNTSFIMYVGRNMLEAISNSETQHLVSAMHRGAKVVVLDPRMSKSAALATEWIPIRPGTDLAFLLAMLNVLIGEKIYDEEFVSKYTVGFDTLAAEVKKYTPEWAETKTEIKASTIRRIAREFAIASPKAFIHPNWRTSNFINSFQTERAIACLNAIIGNWEKVGGQCTIFDEGEGVPLGEIHQPPYPRVRAPRLDGVPWKYPLVPLKLGIFQNIRDAILSGEPYQAHGWFIYRQNPMMSLPNRRKTHQAFAKLDFITTIDIKMNDSAWFSDVVLPEATYLERYDPLAHVDGKVYLRQPLIEPLFDSKQGLEIFKLIGERLGLHDYFNYKNSEDYLRIQASTLPISFEDLKREGYYQPPPEIAKSEEIVFNTPSKKVELESSLLKNNNFNAVPTWEEPPSPGKNEFYLLTGKVAVHSQFSTQNNKWLNALYPENVLWLHTSSAEARSIKNGDKVVVESDIGKIKLRAYVTEMIRPDCVFTTQGFGHLSRGLRVAFGKGASDSDVHVTFTDPVSGGQALSQTFVKVYKA